MLTASIVKSVFDVENEARSSCPAVQLGPEIRKKLGLQALAHAKPVSHLAVENRVSRKFVYRQAAQVQGAVDEAFAGAEEDEAVLFKIPVTRAWIKQVVLAEVLLCHASFRGVIEFLEAVFDYPGLSEGSIHNIVQDAVLNSRTINATEDLSGVRVGAHDEIFQNGRPVLVGADVSSTYCYLLAAEDHRDETTWGLHLLELAERGLHPDYTIADGGQGLRAGQAAAWGPGVPCHGDVFHAERELGQLAIYLEHRAWGCLSAEATLEGKIKRARRRAKGSKFSKKLGHARKAQAQAVRLADDIAVLSDWMHHDVLSLAGPDLATRRQLFDFIVEELRQREPLCPHRIGPVRQKLENQRDDLLAFAAVLAEHFADIATRLHVPELLVQQVCELQGFDQTTPAYWQRHEVLHRKLGGKFHDLETAVIEAMAQTPRASSHVENLNSRLRNYFFLRRHIGNDYLDLLRFFLNHRRFIRSRRPQRTGKSPAELLTGKTHPHWLEMLGFQQFRRN